MEQINKYLYENYDVVVIDEDDDCEFDRGLMERILAYGASERKEGYKKGFDDGHQESEDHNSQDYK